MNLKYVLRYVPENSRGMSKNIVASSVAAVLGSCTPLEVLPHHQLNRDMEPQMQNGLLPYQSIDKILSGQSSAIEENSLGGLLGSLHQPPEKPEEYVDDNGNIFTRAQLESGNQ